MNFDSSNLHIISLQNENKQIEVEQAPNEDDDTLENLTPSQKESRLLSLLATQLAMLLAMAGCSFTIAIKFLWLFIKKYDMDLFRIPMTVKIKVKRLK